MSLLRAYTLPHPPLAVPAVGRGQERGISDTLAAFQEVAGEIAGLAPETVVYITPHNVVYADYFHISPGKSARGDFSRFGAGSARLEARYDEELASEIARLAEEVGIPAGFKGERDASLDHGTMVPMWFVNGAGGAGSAGGGSAGADGAKATRDYKVVRISQSGLAPIEHYKLGRLVAEASKNIGRKIVFIASSDLSHKLKDDGPYGFAPEGPKFDKAVCDALAKGDFLALLGISEDLREGAAECGFRSLATLAGCFDRQQVKARLISYEGPFGVGYAVASFEPGEPDDARDICDQVEAAVLAKAVEKRRGEDAWRALARQSLEHTVKTGKSLPMPEKLPNALTDERAGVFVSLHVDGRLRGCIGTIAPTTKCVAQEIIQNAVSAGLNDPRFEQVTESELPLLTYKVDVLSEPEPIAGPSQLDVKRYGVIVTNGYKRGLLLPNLDGIDTVEQQIDIARRKAGISSGEDVKLERFEVIRHE
jgi:AmmeMemoRadiSam system protein A